VNANCISKSDLRFVDLSCSQLAPAKKGSESDVECDLMCLLSEPISQTGPPGAVREYSGDPLFWRIFPLRAGMIFC